jgi:hypothetical protein
MFSIPGEHGCTLNGMVRVVSKANGTAGEGCVGVSERSGLFVSFRFRRDGGGTLMGAERARVLWLGFI